MIHKTNRMEGRRDYVSRLISLWQRESRYLVLLFLAVTVFHWRGIRPGYTFLPVDLASNNKPWVAEHSQSLQNWLISDPLYQYYPFLTQATQALRDLRWPLWNPNIMMGHPSFADPLSQSFYPITLLAGLLFGPARGLVITFWFHAVLAALLTYGWLRNAGRGQLASAAGSLTYALGGYMVTWFETTFWVSTLSLLPGVLWAFDAAVRKRRVRYLGIAGLLLGAAILAGQLQFVGSFALFLGAYALGHALAGLRSEGGAIGLAAVVWPLTGFVVVISLAAAIGAVAVLPFAELLPLSRRATELGLQDKLPLSYLVTLVIPDFFGNPATHGSYWGDVNFSEGTLYAGLVALLLASAAPFATRRFFTAYLTLLAIVLLVVIVGGPGVSLFSSVPGIKYLSLHRSAFLLPLLVAFLAASAIDSPAVSWRVVLTSSMLFAGLILLAFYLNTGDALNYLHELRGPHLRAITWLIITPTLVLLRRKRHDWTKWLSWSLVILVFIDLFTFGHTYNPVGKVSELMPVTPAVEHLQRNLGTHRLATLQLDDTITFGPNVPSIFGLAEAGGYSSVVLERYHQLVQAGDPHLDVWWMNREANMVTFSYPSQQMLDLFQVSHVASPLPLPQMLSIQPEFVNDACQAATATVKDKERLMGSFVVQDTAINRLDFRLSVPLSAARERDLLVRLKEGERLVLEDRVDTTHLQDGQVLTFFFAPEQQAPSKRYVWEVSSDGDTGVALCLAADGTPAISVYGSDWVVAYEGEVIVYERLAPMPRAYVVYGARTVIDDDDTVAQLIDPDFPLRMQVITAEPVDLPSAAPLPLTPALITTYGETQVVISTTAATDGLLVLGDQYYPGWEARVDGEPVPIIRTNHIFRGVRLAPGEHEVVFTFRPSSLWHGVAMTSFGLILALVLILGDRRPVQSHVRDGSANRSDAPE
jgi:hypothetical protein